MMIFLLLLFGADWKSFETEVFRPLSQDEITVVDHKIFMIHQASAQIFVFDEHGKKIKSFGGKGQGPGEMMVPLRIDHDDQYLYVVDPQTAQIHIFDFEGKYIDRYSLPAREAEYIKVNGGWAYGDWMFSMDPKKPIDLMFANGKLREEQKITDWPRDKTQGGMVIMEDGSGNTPKIPFNPAQDRVSWACGKDGKKLYISQGHDFNIKVFSFPEGSEGETIKIQVPAIPFNEEWGDKRFKAVKERSPQMAAMMEPKYPETFPAIRNLFVTPDGLLVAEAWTGRPEIDRQYYFFDAAGKQVSSELGQAGVEQWVGIINSQAVLLLWDAEEEVAGLASVPFKQMPAFLKQNPIRYDGPGRMVNIQIDN